MNTDRKIIATAYALSFKNPVYVLSNDCGILNVMNRINNHMEDNSYRIKYSLSIPKNLPEFRSVDFELDPSKLPAVR